MDAECGVEGVRHGGQDQQQQYECRSTQDHARPADRTSRPVPK